MSAIWGYINLNSAKKDLASKIQKVSSLMKQPYKECAIDRFEEKSFDNGFFACGIQYFNMRSRNEVLPVYDKEIDVYFTADIVLNDRKKLVSELQKEGLSQVSLSTPDGELAFNSWKKWGIDFTKHITGLFTIAIYEKRKNKFYLFTDHTGCRCADYCICGEELFFSTLTDPILNVMPSLYRGYDEQFITGCEVFSVPYMYVFPERTPFSNIFHTVRGQYISARMASGKWRYCSKTYYVPGTVATKTYKWPENPEDPVYRETFRKVFSDCVSDAIDTDGEVAATISSGLDSSSVATVAAKLMQDENRTLYGYTSIPLKEFEYENPGFDMPDESKGVKNIVQGYPNIESVYYDCDGMSAFTEMGELTNIFELPVRAAINNVWLKYIVDIASKKGCKVLLNGGFGNFTISRGDAKSFFFQKLLSGNVIEAKNQLAQFGCKYGVPRKVLLNEVLKEIGVDLTAKVGLRVSNLSSMDNELLKSSLMKKYRIKQVMKKRFNYYGSSKVETIKKMYRRLGDINILQTQGMYDTKYSVRYGILFRDPTKDKRLLELCTSFPPEQYVYNGLERRLVREYLDDYIPDYERLQVKYKGRQSADKVTRLKAFGDNHKKINLNTRVYDFFNRDKVSVLMEKDITMDNVLEIVKVMSLQSFFQKYENRLM